MGVRKREDEDESAVLDAKKGHKTQPPLVQMQLLPGPWKRWLGCTLHAIWDFLEMQSHIFQAHSERLKHTAGENVSALYSDTDLLFCPLFSFADVQIT